MFIKKKQIDNIIYFSHSIGGIIPILLHKRFLKNQIKIKNFINYEGNLTEFDTKTSTLKTSKYTLKQFKKINGLLKKANKIININKIILYFLIKSNLFENNVDIFLGVVFFKIIIFHAKFFIF